jgi:hypothetical protein
MTSKAQKDANSRYRAKLADRGLVRMEVVVPEKDRDAVKAFAEKLTADASASPSRVPTGAEIWEALRNAPPALGELEFDRREFDLRTIDL